MTATAAAPSAKVVSVTADNFNRADTDRYFGDFVKLGALRLYGPKKEVLDGKWAPPGVQRVTWRLSAGADSAAKKTREARISELP